MAIKKPLVSIVITTKNEESNILACLQSVKSQTYKNVEILVVDNASTDNTKKIARKFTSNVFDKGPERSAQRNFGAKKSKGHYVFFIDADMILTKHVVESCVVSMQKNNAGGLFIPEKSIGVGFWAACKALERSFYVGNENIEAARFFNKEKFLSVGGYDESLTGPEDWDLSQKVKTKYGLSRISTFIIHNEGDISLAETIAKKYYYSKKLRMYMKKKHNSHAAQIQLSPFARYGIFLAHPKKLFHNPVLGLGVLFMKTVEFIAGLYGLVR